MWSAAIFVWCFKGYVLNVFALISYYFRCLLCVRVSGLVGSTDQRTMVIFILILEKVAIFY